MSTHRFPRPGRGWGGGAGRQSKRTRTGARTGAQSERGCWRRGLTGRWAAAGPRLTCSRTGACQRHRHRYSPDPQSQTWSTEGHTCAHAGTYTRGTRCQAPASPPLLFRPLWQHKARAARREHRIRHPRPNPSWSYRRQPGQRRLKQLWEGDLKVSPWPKDCGGWFSALLASNGTSRITTALLKPIYTQESRGMGQLQVSLTGQRQWPKYSEHLK